MANIKFVAPWFFLAWSIPLDVAESFGFVCHSRNHRAGFGLWSASGGEAEYDTDFLATPKPEKMKARSGKAKSVHVATAELPLANGGANFLVTKAKPKGRPECVSAAMSKRYYEKFQEREDLRRSKLHPEQNKPVSLSPPTVRNQATPPSVARNRKPAFNKSKATKLSRHARKRSARKRTYQRDSEIPDYSFTELLTPREEYALGKRVQLLVRSEEVYWGWKQENLREPTIREWANACGYNEEDNNPSWEVEGMSDVLRPASNDPPNVDPDFFVGKGMAKRNGVGRGRKKNQTYPRFLEDFFDDTDVRFSRGVKTEKPPKPTNRGTSSDFVEMILRGRNAKKRMIHCNMRLVVCIAKKYKGVGVKPEDLVQEGSLGLSRAVERFDPSRGFKFSTYASWWVQQAVFRSMAYHSRIVRLPMHIHAFLNKLRRIRRALTQELDRKPTSIELAAAMDISLEKYERIMRLTKKTISLELPKYSGNPKDDGESSELRIVDTIESSAVFSDTSSPERAAHDVLFKDDLQEILQVLEEDERKVVDLRYGLVDGCTRTAPEVSQIMKKPLNWVRSREFRALRKLRRPWYAKTLRDHQMYLKKSKR